MTEVFLDRMKETSDATFGMLTMDGENLCFTLELPWRDNHHDESCIPPGTYPCTKYSSIKHPKAWRVNEVPGRGGILIHVGNFPHDTKGCILVGTAMGVYTGKPAVLHSVDAMAILQEKLPDSFDLVIS